MIEFKSQRDFVRETLSREVDLRAHGIDYVPKEREARPSLDYRAQLNSEGVPANIVSAGYTFKPGTELNEVGEQQ